MKQSLNEDNFFIIWQLKSIAELSCFKQMLKWNIRGQIQAALILLFDFFVKIWFCYKKIIFVYLKSNLALKSNKSHNL